MTDAATGRPIGQVAAASGLTVRTLHHWDAIGLLSPSSRTGAGHRLYTEDDLLRLYQVLALRGLGLSLETIASCLDSGSDPERVLRDHRAGVEAAITSLEELRRRLLGIEGELGAAGRPAIDAVLDAVRAMSTGGPERAEALRRHLDDGQLDALRDRRAAWGPGAPHAVEVEWPELYRRAQTLRLAGAPPADPRVRALVARMDELSERFSGGDRALSAGVRRAWREEPEAMSGRSGAQTAGWRELADYLDAARTNT